MGNQMQPQRRGVLGAMRAAARLAFWFSNSIFGLWFFWRWTYGKWGDALGTLNWKVAALAWIAIAIFFGAIGISGPRNRIGT